MLRISEQGGTAAGMGGQDEPVAFQLGHAERRRQPLESELDELAETAGGGESRKAVAAPAGAAEEVPARKQRERRSSSPWCAVLARRIRPVETTAWLEIAGDVKPGDCRQRVTVQVDHDIHRARRSRQVVPRKDQIRPDASMLSQQRHLLDRHRAAPTCPAEVSRFARFAGPLEDVLVELRVVGQIAERLELFLARDLARCPITSDSDDGEIIRTGDQSPRIGRNEGHRNRLADIAADVATMHYFWIGAVPAMLFLGIVMMPFYYGSKVRSVPEFMRRRFGTGAHLVNAISFAVAQILIAGINLYLLAHIVELLLGWPLWVSLIIAAIVVLSYITLGGLSAAIYNEVLQFFVIVAALLPLTLIGLHRVGGVGGLVDKVTAAGNEEMLSSWPATEPDRASRARSGRSSASSSASGFVLSFGYWTTNFVEVQRAMATHSISAARATPIIGSFPKMFVPFIVVIPGHHRHGPGAGGRRGQGVRRTRTSTTTTRSCT